MLYLAQHISFTFFASHPSLHFFSCFPIKLSHICVTHNVWQRYNFIYALGNPQHVQHIQQNLYYSIAILLKIPVSKHKIDLTNVYFLFQCSKNPFLTISIMFCLHGPLTLLVVVHLPIGQVYRNIHWVFPLGTYGNCPWDNALLFASSVKRPGKHWLSLSFFVRFSSNLLVARYPASS